MPSRDAVRRRLRLAGWTMAGKLRAGRSGSAPHPSRYSGDADARTTAGHMIQEWTANAGGEVTPPDDAVLRFHEHSVGTPPPPDEGCNMLSVLKYWRKAGLARHKVLAFAALEPSNQVQAQDALFMFGSIYIGVALPDFATQETCSRCPGWYRHRDRPARRPRTRTMATASAPSRTTHAICLWSCGAP